jgi:hypothetical protein
LDTPILNYAKTHQNQNGPRQRRHIRHRRVALFVPQGLRKLASHIVAGKTCVKKSRPEGTPEKPDASIVLSGHLFFLIAPATS